MKAGAFYLGAFLLLVTFFVVGYAAGHSEANNQWQRNLVSVGLADYDPHTGEWRLKNAKLR
jgi:hypothetical protein